MPSRRQGTLVLTTSDYSLDLHMRGMLRDLAGRGTGPVHIAASDSGRLDRVARREGVSAHAVRMRRDTSPLHDLLSLVHLIGLYARLRPAVTVYGTPKAALLGAIAAFGIARSGKLFIRAVIGMALGFTYFVVDNFALAMGNLGAYPPMLAAWAPFVLFLMIGEAVLIRTEE